MVGSGIIWVKTLVKSSLDNYVLPGTVAGTEILWLYLIQWRRDFAALLSATGYLLVTQRELRKFECLFQRGKSSETE